MRVLSIAAFVFLGCLLSGCIVTSRQPFYAEKDVVWDPSLVGVWTVVQEGQTAWPTETWTFEKAQNLESAYRLTVVEYDGVGAFTAHLFKLADRTFLDLLPGDVTHECSESLDMCVSFTYLVHWHMVPTHSVLRIWLEGDTMKLAALDRDWFGRQTVKDTAALQVEAAGGESSGGESLGAEPDEETGVYLLNGSTSNIQKFMTEHATDGEAFAESVVLRRAQPPTPAK